MIYSDLHWFYLAFNGNSRGIVANVLDCDIVVSEFEHHSPYYVHFRTNTLGEGVNPLITPSYGLNSVTTVFKQEWLRH